jgi:hypothetical protein
MDRFLVAHEWVGAVGAVAEPYLAEGKVSPYQAPAGRIDLAAQGMGCSEFAGGFRIGSHRDLHLAHGNLGR